MMKVLLILFASLLAGSGYYVREINTRIDPKYREPSLEEYRFIDLPDTHHWSYWAFVGGSFGRITGDSLGKNYGLSNLSDYDLTTTWAIGVNQSKKIHIEIKYYDDDCYEKKPLENFIGKIFLFNGYCKSQKLWEENSRVKKMNVYYNHQLLCRLNIEDNWHPQIFSLEPFFYDESHKDNKIKVRTGDIITLEITDVYQGSKYDDICISGIYMECEEGG